MLSDKKRSVEIGDVFNVDTKVVVDGLYICVPCGDKKYFQADEIFPRCFECISNEGNPDKLRKGLGLWELKKISSGEAYRCPVCGLHYHEKSTAEKCETFCTEYKSCSLELIKISVEEERI